MTAAGIALTLAMLATLAGLAYVAIRAHDRERKAYEAQRVAERAAELEADQRGVLELKVAQATAERDVARRVAQQAEEALRSERRARNDALEAKAKADASGGGDGVRAALDRLRSNQDR